MEAPPPAPSPRSPEAPTASSASPTVAAAAEPPDDAIAHAPLPCAPPPETPSLPVLPTPPALLVVAAAVPTETHFASREQLLAHVHAFSLRHGYAVVIQKSNVPRGQLWLRCDLGGSYRSASSSNSNSNSSSSSSGGGTAATESRKRKSSSRLQNCPFQLYARRLPDARWLLKVQNAAHNHTVDPAQLEAHPAARRLSLAQKQLVDELTRVGARPAHIVEKLKEQFPDKPVKVQDVYNARNYIRRERGAGRVPFAQKSQAGSGLESEEESANPTLAVSLERPSGEQQHVASSTAALGTARPLVPPAHAALGSSSAPSSGVKHGSARSSIIGSNSNSTISSSATTERLQSLLDGASTQFSAWQPRTQKQFLFQLEVLLARCIKSEGARGAPSSSSSSAGGDGSGGPRSASPHQASGEDASATDSTSSTGSVVDASAAAAAAAARVGGSNGDAPSSAAAVLPLLPESAL